MRKTLVLAVAAMSLALTGCPKKEKEKKPDVTKAGGNIEAKSGSKVSGNVEFEMAPDGRLKMTLNVQGLTPGDHGVHIHETGDCSAPDAASAGGHFNPTEMAHGAPGGPAHHAGDLGNMNANANGTGAMTMSISGLSLNEKKTSVVGKALIVHEKADDMTTQPTGGAAGRVGCVVIKAM